MADPNSPMRGAGQDLDRYLSRHGLVGQRTGCTYCGSLSPEAFLDAVKAGAEIGPTDKSYKLYVEKRGEWGGKFYTPHFELDQPRAQEFYDLWLAGRVTWGYPGHPYVRLYLPGVTPAAATAAAEPDQTNGE
jgi:hypothetical protein